MSREPRSGCQIVVPGGFLGEFVRRLIPMLDVTSLRLLGEWFERSLWLDFGQNQPQAAAASRDEVRIVVSARSCLRSLSRCTALEAKRVTSSKISKMGVNSLTKFS